MLSFKTTATLIVYIYVGQQCVQLLREELGPDLANVHAPITLGGVQLHKLQGAVQLQVEMYKPILIEVLNLFGTAIHTSLERTMGKYLKATDGIFRNELRPDWQLEKVSLLLCTNNPAERPFAVAKGMSLELPPPPI